MTLIDVASAAAGAVADRLMGRNEPEVLPESGTIGAKRTNGSITLWSACPSCGGDCTWRGVVRDLGGGTKYQLGSECGCQAAP